MKNHSRSPSTLEILSSRTRLDYLADDYYVIARFEVVLHSTFQMLDAFLYYGLLHFLAGPASRLSLSNLSWSLPLVVSH